MVRQFGELDFLQNYRSRLAPLVAAWSMPSSVRSSCSRSRERLEFRSAFWVEFTWRNTDRAESTQSCRFLADVLNGVPSITWGVVVYGLVVLRFKGFSAYAGGLALGLIMIPLILRTTEEVVLLVPNGYREAALALGVSRLENDCPYRDEDRVKGHHHRDSCSRSPAWAVKTAPLLLRFRQSILESQP
jgi:hypothetical protein